MQVNVYTSRVALLAAEFRWKCVGHIYVGHLPPLTRPQVQGWLEWLLLHRAQSGRFFAGRRPPPRLVNF